MLLYLFVGGDGGGCVPRRILQTHIGSVVDQNLDDVRKAAARGDVKHCVAGVGLHVDLGPGAQHLVD